MNIGSWHKDDREPAGRVPPSGQICEIYVGTWGGYAGGDRAVWGTAAPVIAKQGTTDQS